MADYKSQEEGSEEMPFDVERASRTTNTFPCTSNGLAVDSAGFPAPRPRVNSAGSLLQGCNPSATSVTAQPFNQAADHRNVYLTPPRPKRSHLHPATPDTISSRQDEEERGRTDFFNFYKELEQGGNQNSTAQSAEKKSENSSKDPDKQKRCFKTKSAKLAALLMVLILFTVLITTSILLFGEKSDSNLAAQFFDRSAAPFETMGPSTSPSRYPTPKPTRLPTFRPRGTPTSRPTRSPSSMPTRTPTPPPTSFPNTYSPTASFEAPIRDFLFHDNDVSVEPMNPVVQKAMKWLVDEANAAKSLVFPLDPKYLQRFGILILYLSIAPNVDASSSDKVRLPNVSMRNQNECSWIGMRCDENGLVTAIKLSNLQLEGSLPAKWGFFPNLKSIDFSKNQLQGSIPEGIYDIVGLEEVHLYNNRLAGTISSKIGNLWSLRNFHLSHNLLSGSIPPELMSPDDELRPLRSFNVHRNQMTGSIPSNMRLRQLYYMDLGRNKISGTLPPDLGTESVRLRHLYLDHNDLEGTFPNEVLNAGDGRLRALSLNNNHFTGTFPGDHQLLNYMGTRHVLFYHPHMICHSSPYCSVVSLELQSS